MKSLLIILAFVLCIAPAASADEKPVRDLYADTWVATDTLGREMPLHEDVGPAKKDQRRVVSIFYLAWHRDAMADLKAPYKGDVTKILHEAPEARLDADHPLWQYGAYHWGEPEFGYFLSKDKYVIRQEMAMLSDAGVDVLVMDVTNAVRYWDEWDVIFSTMLEMKAEGNQVPQFCFWAFNGPVITVVQDLYERIYKEEKFKELWFEWDGKPLLLYNGTPDVDATGNKPQHKNLHYEPAAATDPNHPHYGDPYYAREFYEDYTDEVKDFFTLRTMWWGYYKWAGERFVGTEGNWSFGYDLGNEKVAAMNPADLVAPHDGKKEQAAVTPAQHPTSMVGKSWTREHGEPELDEHDEPAPTHVPWLGEKVEDPEGYGIYFQERWDEALPVDPEFLYINDWNEWIAGKFHPAEGQTFPFLGRASDYYFVDQYNAEFNRCVQPMKGGYTDNYYMQMAQNIRRYKGARPIPELSGLTSINIDGEFEDWQAVEVEYRDTIGDTIHRDYPGYGGEHYTNTSGRNDIITSKVAVDEENVYFLAETNEPLTQPSNENWMLLLIDADKDHSTGWYGYDFLINKNLEPLRALGYPASAQESTLMRYEDGEWVEQAKLPYSYPVGKQLELAVPREALGLQDDAFTFDFHWADNPADLKDPISLCTHGDSAPNRRFNYRCIWKE